MKSLKRRRRTDVLSGDARPRTADPERSGHYYNDSKVLSMVDLTMISSHSFQQTIERPRTASGIPLDREHNGLSLNPPTPFVYDRSSQSLRPAGCMPEAQSQDPQIGLALGSPRELLDYVAESANDNSHPPLNRWQTLGPDRGFTNDQGSQLSEEVDRPSKPKARRWKSVSGFLGRIRSSTITQPPVPPVPLQYGQPVAVPVTTPIVKTSLDSAKKSLHMKRKTKTGISPNLFRNETNKRHYPPLLIPQNTFLKSGPVSAMSPQIDVVIPTAELDRCSVMFEDRLRLQQLQNKQRQSQPVQSLLERRQKAGVDLKLMNPEVKQDRTVQSQPISEVTAVAAAEHRPARSSSLLHFKGKSVAASSGFKYDRISTTSQPLFIAQEDDEFGYDDDDVCEDDKSCEPSNSSTLMTDIDESPEQGKEDKATHIPKAPSRAPPPPPAPPAFVFSAPNSKLNPTETLEQAAVRYSVMSVSSRNSWSSAAVALVPSPTWSSGAYFPPSPTVSTSDFPSLPYLSPWDPSAPFSASPSLVTCSPEMTSEKQFPSPGLTPPPHSAMSNISKFGYDAPHSPLLAIAHTVSVIMASKSGEDLRASAAQEAYEHREKGTEAGVATVKQGARFLTRSRSERLVAGYSSGRVATPTFVSVSGTARAAAGGDARSCHEGADADVDVIFVDQQASNVMSDAAAAAAAGCRLAAADEDKNEAEATFWAMAATRRSCRGSLIDM